MAQNVDPMNPDTVSGKAGDTGTVLKTDWDTAEGEWVWVKLNGKEGWAPLSFLRKVTPSSRPASEAK